MNPDPLPSSTGRPDRFGVASLVFVVVSSMVGTGVLTTSGYSILGVGNGLMPWLWVVGGVIAIAGALSLAELSAMMPETGGDYRYLSAAYGPSVGFLSGWVSFLIGFGGPIAASSTAAADYLTVPFGLPPATSWYAVRGLATALIVGFAFIHTRGLGASIRLQGGVTIFKLVVLATIASVGLALGWSNRAGFDPWPAWNASTIGPASIALLYVSYAYTGWNAASYLAGEVDRPQARLPRAILLGAGGVTALYLALNFAYSLAVSREMLQRLVDRSGGDFDAVRPIAQIAARRLVGDRPADALSILLGLTLLASVSAYILTGPRVLMAMALDGHFPRFAARLSVRGAPALATLIQSGWALVLLWTSPFEEILIYAGVGLAAFSMLTVGSVVVLRVRRPDAPRPFRVPGYPLTPLIYLVGTGTLVAVASADRPFAARLCAGTVAAGLLVYLVWTWAKSKPGPEGDLAGR